ncbi:serine/threonine protein phosphatase, putative [Trypanosoma brucei gambiense DAL972]|uniref:Serine/threonine-protein phosphatase n=1 Tax=Trypanosoma brucei gambiense (strain MHOM/CI/86/DAL972) TaxID=679716 RepID=D0A9C5_TRYB9|nr:serine/threonine protein phosphatase, putative [Trypanosoma brucei gambiense DAL972]CBH18276.1 serine/threonine protein phosphatase, putative [Trypanosoma brucei gambiense DAL972]|eukprot:XP_011780540.1 serine/threonine protein phosphatase, putative [Trypanosoma brucei gambiense DAL972]
MSSSEAVKALASLTKEELMQRVLELQGKNAELYDEVEQLRQRLSQNRIPDVSKPRVSIRHSCDVGSCSPSRFSTLASSVGGQYGSYTVSLSVLVIENGNSMTVPLSSILDKSYKRPDMREPDTPAVSMSAMRDESDPHGRFSADHCDIIRSPSMGIDGPAGGGAELRGVTFGAAAAAAVSATSGCGGCRPSIMVGFSRADDQSEPPPRDPSSCRPPMSVQPISASLDAPRHDIQRFSSGRPLGVREGSLASDGLVSHRTLRTFNQQVIDGYSAPSPMSSRGSAVFHYIVRNFTLNNECRHNSDDVEGFGRALCSLCEEVKRVLKSEPRHGSSYSPCYVFGDIHGNFIDLFYFLDNLISFQDLRYTPHRFVFLGDYVDRGPFSVEVVAYLFAMKVLAPDKVLLLRGNHEDSLVSGDIAGYGHTSFRAQCRELFGFTLGEEVWNCVSDTFAYLPLTANIDGKIFCTHGGIPRYSGGADDRLSQLSRGDFPVMRTLFQAPADETPQQRQLRQLAMDTCWADPAEDETQLDRWGFGDNPRGRGVILFGSKAVDDFLGNHNYEYIFRAHQEKSDGLKLSKNARVFTIFSTSAYVGHENGAGVVLVADGKIRLIIKNADSIEMDPETNVPTAHGNEELENGPR